MTKLVAVDGTVVVVLGAAVATVVALTDARVERAGKLAKTALPADAAGLANSSLRSDAPPPPRDRVSTSPTVTVCTCR